MDVEKIVGEVKANVEAFKVENKKLIDGLKESTALQGDKIEAAVKQAEVLAQKVQDHAANIVALEQKLAEGVQRGKAAIETLGQMVIKTQGFTEFAAGKTNKMRIEANTIIGQEGSPPTNSDVLVAPDRLPGIIPGRFRALRVRDVMPGGQTTSNMIQFTRELSWTNNAAETVEGASKPQSAITFELVNAPVVTVAHWLKASKQILDDAPALQAYIDNRLRYGVEYRIDSQLVNGNGTGQNISGILDSGNYTAFNPVAGDNALDSINRAKYDIIGSDYMPTAVMMNPADWGQIERLKKGTGDASYIIGDPMGQIVPMLWGLPVVVTNAVPAGTFIISDFMTSYQVFNRMGTVVEMSESDDVNFQKNLITIRAEARLAMATYVPLATRAGLLVAAAS